MAWTRSGVIGFVFLALAWPCAAQGQVWVLGTSGPGIDFTSPQAAIDAAADGDVILVKPGSYGGSPNLVVSGKSLVIAADGGTVNFVAGMRIESLAAGQVVVVRGITFTVTTMVGSAGPGVLTLANDAGTVWIEEAVLGSTVFWPRIGLDASQCAAVALERCSIVGTDLTGLAVFGAGPDGVRAVSSNLALHGCESRGGGAGFFFPGTPGSDGGQGLRVTGGFVFAGHSRLIGGDGGFVFPDTFVPCPPGGDGGDGLHVESPATQAWSQAGQFLGGKAGAGSACPGLPGQPVSAPAGSYTAYPGAGHSFAASSPVREGQSTTLTFGGRPGELIFAAYSAQPGFSPLAPVGGVLLLAPSFGVATAGVVPPSGSGLALAVPIGELGPGIEFVRLFVQAAAFDPATLAISIGGASSVLLLDAAL